VPPCDPSPCGQVALLLSKLPTSLQQFCSNSLLHSTETAVQLRILGKKPAQPSDIQQANHRKRMYIRNPNAAANPAKRNPDIHTPDEKNLFKSTFFLSV
jgi:hypothetical protein